MSFGTQNIHSQCKTWKQPKNVQLEVRGIEVGDFLFPLIYLSIPSATKSRLCRRSLMHVSQMNK